MKKAHNATGNGDIETLRSILKEERELDINEILNFRTLLFLACENGKIECVKELLSRYEKDIDVNIGCGGFLEQTPLYIAISKGHVEIAIELLKHPRIDVNKGSFAETPIQVCCDLGHVEILKHLLFHPDVLPDITGGEHIQLEVKLLLEDFVNQKRQKNEKNEYDEEEDEGEISNLKMYLKNRERGWKNKKTEEIVDYIVRLKSDLRKSKKENEEKDLKILKLEKEIEKLKNKRFI